MSKQSHTPGWYVQDNTDQIGGQLRVDCPLEGAIADLGKAPFVDDQMRRRAHLIAAAPDLKSKMESQRERIAQAILSPPSNMGAFLQDLLDDSEGAIAKAKAGA